MRLPPKTASILFLVPMTVQWRSRCHRKRLIAVLAGMDDLTSLRLSYSTPPGGNWCGNALRFNSKEEAEEYGRNLYNRWSAVKEWNVVGVPDE